MLNLIFKEFSLSAHPTLYFFMLLGAMVLIPAYPYGVIFFFGCLCSYFTFMYGRETNDIFYSTLLPIKKSDVVKGRCLLLVISELILLLISLPFAVIRRYILPDGNPVGMEANVAFYGFGLIIFTIFNLILLTEFYKTAYKIGKSFMIAIIPVLIAIVLMEVLPHLPATKWVDGSTYDMQIKQLPILFMGIIMFVAGTFITYRTAKSNFEKVDL